MSESISNTPSYSTADTTAHAAAAPDIGAALDGTGGEARLGAHTACDGESGKKDAPPTNRASSNCKEGESDYFQVLRFGVDSLYLSYAGEMFPAMKGELQRLKEIAQSPEEYQQATAQCPVGEHVFKVQDKGARLFPFILEDNAFRLQLSPSSKNVPLAYAKVSSHFLCYRTPLEAGRELHQVVSAFGEITEGERVSRIDLFVDFVCPEDMESWDRRAWISRARRVDAHAVNDQFSGWSIGLGGIISARLYDKTLEIETSHKSYMRELWKEAGWDGESKVWRLEFELKREVLTQHGLSSLGSVLTHLNGLWSYATTEWLRLAIPQEQDQTRSRWPIHPMWAYLASVDWESNGGPLLRRYSNAKLPSNEKLFGMSLSLIISYMARERIQDFYEGLKEFEAALYVFHEQRSFNMGQPFDDYIAERVAIKSREFCSLLNPAPKEDQAEQLRQEAAAYRKQADGE